MLNLVSKWVIGAGLVAAAIAWAWFEGRSAGVAAERIAAASKLTAAEQEYRERANHLEEQLQAARNETKVKVRTVYRVKDDTGCADTAAPSGVLDQLR